MSRIGSEGERRLEALSNESVSDDAWLEDVAEIGVRQKMESESETVVAAILFVADRKL